jgi:subtilisin family serine protease
MPERRLSMGGHMADDEKRPRRARAPKQMSGQELFEERKHLLDRSLIAVPLLEQIERHPRKRRAVIIDVNLEHPGGAEAAKARIVSAIREITKTEQARQDAGPRHLAGPGDGGGREPVDEVKTAALPQYVIAELSGSEIRELLRRDRAHRAEGTAPAIHRIWPDFPLEAHITRSVRTVKCDAARIAYSALGEGITWAVMDSGIAGDHPHFVEHRNLSNVRGGGKLPWAHQDFTGGDSPLTDEFGHGTHVAGILAGEVPPPGARRAADVEEAAAEDGAAAPAAGDASPAAPPPPAVAGPI